MPEATIVIPCYNEEKRLPLKDYGEFLDRNIVHLLFVNDGSTDRTHGILEELKDRFPGKVSVLHLTTNCGKAEAVRSGVLSLKAHSNAAIIGFMDADLSTPLKESAYFIEAFDDPRIEFAFGSRVCRIGARVTRLHFYRWFFGRMLATAISVYLNIPVYDTQCGVKFFRNGVAQQLFARPFLTRWLFDVELFRRMALLDIPIEECALELPLHVWIEKTGSKIRVKDCIRLPIDFFSIVRQYRPKNHYKYLASPLSITSTPVKLIAEKEPAEQPNLHP